VHQTVRSSDPYVILRYTDQLYIDNQDALTCAVCVDLLCDLSIHVTQPAHNVIVFDNSRDMTLALLYMGRYDHFTYTVHQYSVAS